MKSKLNSVLLIDDDIPTNVFTRIILQDAGCVEQIHVATGGEEALNYLSTTESSPDLIFLDINMPAMDGWEFLEEYRKLSKERRSKAIVVMLTTSLNPDDRIKAENNPLITCFETKPLSEEKVEKILKNHFRQYFTDKGFQNSRS